MSKKIFKSRTDVKIDGVCSGIANYFGMDPTLVRLIWIAALFFGGTGIIGYIVCAAIMPREPEYIDGEYDQYYEDKRN